MVNSRISRWDGRRCNYFPFFCSCHQQSVQTHSSRRDAGTGARAGRCVRQLGCCFWLNYIHHVARSPPGRPACGQEVHYFVFVLLCYFLLVRIQHGTAEPKTTSAAPISPQNGGRLAKTDAQIWQRFGRNVHCCKTFVSAKIRLGFCQNSGLGMAQKDAQWFHLAPLLLWWPAVKSKVRQRAAQEHSLSLVQLTRCACYHANSPPQPLGGGGSNGRCSNHWGGPMVQIKQIE